MLSMPYTHSNIASLSSYVQFCSIGYSVKAIGINNDLLTTHNYVLAHVDLSKQALVELFGKMKTNQSTIVQQLKKEVPLGKERA